MSQTSGQTQKSQKTLLKEQAKQLLLKGCYKMACNKYLRLIALGLQGLQKRQCAIVYLNCGICFQFMSQFQDSLKMISKSIQIDPGYQKAYYRRLQLLRDNQYYQQALSSIPQWIHNTQIDLLIKQIKEQYFQNMGLARLQEKIREKSVDIVMITDVYSKFYAKIDAKLQSKEMQQEQVQKLSASLKTHYHFMRSFYIANLIYEPNNVEFTKYLQLFFQMLLKLLMLKNQLAFAILSEFLKQFKSNLQTFMKSKAVKRNAKNQILSNINLKQNLALQFSRAQIRIIPFLKCYQQTQFFVRVCSFLTQTYYLKLNSKFQGEVFQNRSKIWLENIDAPFIHMFLATNYVLPNIEIKTTLKLEELQRLKSLIQYDCKKLKQFYDNSKLSLQKFKYLHPIIMSIDSEIKILSNLLQVMKKQSGNNGKAQAIKFTSYLQNITQISHLIYVRNWQIFNRTKSESPNRRQKSNFQIQYEYNKEQVVSFVTENIKDFLITYLFEHIVHFIPKQITRSMLNACQQTLQEIKAQISKYKKNSKSINIKQQLLNERYLILLVITLKIDIKRKISVELSIFQCIQHDLLSDVSLEALLLILINSPVHINNFLINTKRITNLINHFLTKSFIEQIDSMRILINILFILVCNFQNQQQKMFAKNLGVTPEEVHAARKLQGEAQEQFKRKQVEVNRKKFKQVISNEWSQILVKLVNLCIKMKMEQYISDKLSKIIFALAETNPTKLYQFQIVDFMLECKQLKTNSNSKNANNPKYNQNVCKFFQILCRKCNHNIFQYKNLQQIVDCLVWLVSNSDHQLIIFECLLGLVNLSTASVRIPIQEVQKCLYEQNMYIVHAAICIMNNLLIYNQEYVEEEQNKKFKLRISDLVYKYVQFYRDQILIRQVNLAQTDYSHPHKIYSSLLSLSTVLKLNKLQELNSWEGCKKYIKLLGNQASQTLFKLVVYHSLEKSLPKNWKNDFQLELKDLQMKDIQKFNKIIQLE